jgi:hypothetical protein
MERRMLVVGLSLAPLALLGCASTQSMTDPLVGTLTKSLGVTENQASGGVGSMLHLAQEKLPSADFGKVASVIPGSEKYMDMAKSLGAVTGPLTNGAGLSSALGRLGMSAGTAEKFVPAVTDFVGKAAGSNVGSMLSKAML